MLSAALLPATSSSGPPLLALLLRSLLWLLLACCGAAGCAPAAPALLALSKMHTYDNKTITKLTTPPTVIDRYKCQADSKFEIDHVSSWAMASCFEEEEVSDKHCSTNNNTMPWKPFDKRQA